MNHIEGFYMISKIHHEAESQQIILHNININVSYPNEIEWKELDKSWSIKVLQARKLSNRGFVIWMTHLQKIRNMVIITWNNSLWWQGMTRYKYTRGCIKLCSDQSVVISYLGLRPCSYRRFHALGVLQASVDWVDCAAPSDGGFQKSGETWNVVAAFRNELGSAVEVVDFVCDEFQIFQKYETETELSKWYIWEIKKMGHHKAIKHIWQKKRNLQLKIITNKNNNLNSRPELITKCRHPDPGPRDLKKPTSLRAAQSTSQHSPEERRERETAGSEDVN